MKDWADERAEKVVLKWNRSSFTLSFNDLIADELRAVREACAEIADDWGPGINENWENADTHIADAIRKADLSPTLAGRIS